MNTTRTFAGLVALSVALWLLGGCAATSTVSGKVIQGSLGFVGIVDVSDERFKTDGLAGISVTVTKNPQDGGVRIGETKTDAKGDFRVVIKDQSALIRPTAVTASGPGFQPASTVMNIPPASQRVLIILQPAGATGTR